MVAIESHHGESPRSRWKAFYRAERIRRHAGRIYRRAHKGRAKAWLWIGAGLLVFWALFAYAIHSVT